MPEVDRSAAAEFWQRYLASVGEENSEGPTDVACFGDSVELADELIDLVLRGQKRATAGSLAEYESEGDALSEVGDRWIACDGQGRPRAVIETTAVRVGPLSSVVNSSRGTREKVIEHGLTGYEVTRPTSPEHTKH